MLDWFYTLMGVYNTYLRGNMYWSSCASDSRDPNTWNIYLLKVDWQVKLIDIFHTKISPAPSE